MACIAGLGAYHWVLYLPVDDQPHSFAVLDRLFDIGVAAAIVYGGLLIGLRCLTLLRVLSVFGRLEAAGLATGLGLGALSLVVLGLGMLHLYYPITFALLLLAPPLLFAPERRWLAQVARSLPAALHRLPAWRGPSWLDTFACLALAGISLTALCGTFLRDLTIPSANYGYDTYQYHWAVPLLLLRDHGMRAFPGWAHANLPFNTEMLNLIALSLQAPQAATMVQDSFELLGAILTYALIQRHFGALTAWLAVAAEVTVPLLIMFASESYVETALIFYAIAALATLIWWIEGLIRGTQMGYRLLTLLGLFVGLALGVKYTAIMYLPGVMLLLLAGAIAFAWRQGKRHSVKLIASYTAKSQAAFVGAVALAFAPWALKNWLLLGNPVYPALATIFGAPLWNAARDLTLASTFEHFGPHAGLMSRLHLYALDLFIHAERYGEGVRFPTGRLALASGLALPFFWIATHRGWLKRPGKERGQVLVVAALALITLLGLAVWSASGARVERYALPLVILATVLGSVLLGWMVTRLPRRIVLLAWLIVFGAIVVCGQQEWTYLYPTLQARAGLPVLMGSISERALMRAPSPDGWAQDFWQMTDYVNNVLPHNGKLLMLGRGEGYFFEDREYVADSGGDWVPYLVSAGGTSAGMLRLLREQGFDYIVYDAGLMRWLTESYQNYTLASYLPAYVSFQQENLDLVATWGNFTLYRVPEAST
jgi:hypothetical protein